MNATLAEIGPMVVPFLLILGGLVALGVLVLVMAASLLWGVAMTIKDRRDRACRRESFEAEGPGHGSFKGRGGRLGHRPDRPGELPGD